MDAYEELRQQARAKRDKIIRAARLEYQSTSRRIESLRRAMVGGAAPSIRPVRPAARQTLAEKLAEVIPRGRPFTVTEACELLYADPLWCQFKEVSVRGQFPTLAAQGLIRKIGRRNGHVLWAHRECEAEACPFAGATLAEIAHRILSERGPLRVAEIVAAMKDKGYRPQESNKKTYSLLIHAITRTGGRFRKNEAGRWLVGG